nr:MAG TPA: hypothetical protein [Caudoviricetes sp.]
MLRVIIVLLVILILEVLIELICFKEDKYE